MICDDCIHKMVCAKVYSDDWCAFKQTTETINAVIIPANATNGEIYEKIFGYADEETKTVWRFEEDDCKPIRKNMFSKTWWNAPYKRG